MKGKKDNGLIIFGLVAIVVPVVATLLTGFDYVPYAAGYYTGVGTMLVAGSFLTSQKR